MKSLIKQKSVLIIFLLVLISCRQTSDRYDGYKEQFPYLNPGLSSDERLNDLIKRMTLREKIGQMNQYAGISVLEKSKSGDLDQMYSDLKEGIIGSFLLIKDIDESNKLQKIAENSRLKIPFISAIDAIHGHCIYPGATVFPTSISQASSFNEELVKSLNAATAKEMRATGYHWTFFPYFSVSRDPRWGRVGENYGEDPLLVSRLAVAATRGLQGDDYSAPDKVIACGKSFLADGQSINGLNFAPADFSMRTLKEVFLPPAEACVKAGIRTMMASHNEINGIPAHADHWLLTELLRDSWGFDGYVISDWKDISRLETNHHIAGSKKDAINKAISAGVDIHMHSLNFVDELTELVEEGKIPESRIDRTVRQILMDKFKMGLFENRYVDEAEAKKVLRNPEHEKIALEAARQSIVLLKNDSKVLPLSKSLKNILVTGPLADHNAQLGDWVWQQPRENMVSILDGIKKHVGDHINVNYYNPGDIMEIDEKSIKETVNRSKNADAIILVIGDNDNRISNEGVYKGSRPNRTGGENNARADIVLSGKQETLAKALHATGKPVVVVLINGRPLAIEWIAENMSTVVEAWQPGMLGGTAIAEALFGDYNPSGKLAMSFPRSVGHIPYYYNHRPSTYFRNYIDQKTTPLFEFGHGLSYTTFEYSNLSIPISVMDKNPIKISIDVKNTGDRAGDEIVLLYINDKVSSVTTPVKELKEFTRIHLEPGEQKEVIFTLHYDALSLFNKDLKKVVEPGEFEVMVGRLQETFIVND